MLLDILPAGKTGISIKTRGFPGREKAAEEYEFRINCRNLPFVLEIPGEHRGPDNCRPLSETQEKWLDEMEKNPENGIRRIWDCQWQLTDEIALRRFLQMLAPFQIETNYY
jgi:hypothetical protein